MALQQWELDRFQSPAVEMCHRLGMNPFEPIDSMVTGSPPIWLAYARRMAEHWLMVETMRAFGHDA